MKPKYYDWLFPIGLTILIYSTLPVGPRVINSLNNEILKGKLPLCFTLVFMTAGFILMLCLFIRFRFKHPIRYFWLLVIFLIAYGLTLIPGTYAEQIHSFEYAVLGVLWWRVLRYYSSSNWQVYLSTLVITAFSGSVDELIQFFLPNRYFGYDDIIRNASGGGLGMMYLGLVEKRDVASSRLT